MALLRLSSLLTAVGALLIALPARAAPIATISDDTKLKTVVFNTKNGQIQVNMPSEMICGDTISGSIFFVPRGKDEREQGKTEDELNTYVVNVADQSFPTRMGDFTVTVPQGITTFTCALKDKKKTTIGKLEVPLTDKANQVKANCCSFSPIIQSGITFQYWGPFDGNLTHASLRVGGKELTKLAESPRALMMEVPTDMVGKKELVMITPSCIHKGSVNCIKAEVSIADPKIERGKSTTATITVHGLNGLTEPVSLMIVNGSPNVAAIEGGDSQTVQMKPDSGWQFTRNVQGLHSGSFCISAFVVGPHLLPSYVVQSNNQAWQKLAKDGQ